MRRMKEFLCCTVIVSALVSAGCSKISTAYDFADWWIEYRIEKWVDLDSAQEASLQLKLDSVLANHRQVVMPKLVAMGESFVRASQDGRLVADLVKHEALIDQLFYDSVSPIAHSVGDVLQTLSAEQVDELEVGLDEQYKEALERWHEQTKAGTGGMIKRMESWLGELSEEQASILKRSRSWADQRYRFDCRRTRQKELVGALRSQAEPGAVGEILSNWWTVRNCGFKADQARQAARVEWQERMAKFEATLSVDQRKSLSDRMAALVLDLEELLVEPLKR